MSKASKTASDDNFAAVGEASKRMAKWDDEQAEKRARRLTKVTEVVGEHDVGFEWDLIDPVDGGECVRLSTVLPDESVKRRGRWRITVEFEPEEER